MNMHHSSDSPGKFTYLLGFLLALTLTVFSFTVTSLHLDNLDKVPGFARGIVSAWVGDGHPSKASALFLLTMLAIIQLFVHMRYFLHLNFDPKNHTKLAMVMFVIFIIFIAVGGTVWIMSDVDRMMPHN